MAGSLGNGPRMEGVPSPDLAPASLFSFHLWQRLAAPWSNDRNVQRASAARNNCVDHAPHSNAICRTPTHDRVRLYQRDRGQVIVATACMDGGGAKNGLCIDPGLAHRSVDYTAR